MDHIIDLDKKQAEATESIEKRAQWLVFLQWRKYQRDAATYSDAPRRAATVMADCLQSVLEDWSDYGYRLVWGRSK